MDDFLRGYLPSETIGRGPAVTGILGILWEPHCDSKAHGHERTRFGTLRLLSSSSSCCFSFGLCTRFEVFQDLTPLLLGGLGLGFSAWSHWFLGLLCLGWKTVQVCVYLCWVFIYHLVNIFWRRHGEFELRSGSWLQRAPPPLAKLWSSLLRDPLSSSWKEDHPYCAILCSLWWQESTLLNSRVLPMGAWDSPVISNESRNYPVLVHSVKYVRSSIFSSLNLWVDTRVVCLSGCLCEVYSNRRHPVESLERLYC